MTEDCYYVTYDRYGKRFEVKNHDEFIEGCRDVEDAIRLCKMLRRMAEFNGGGDDNLTD